jgi:CRP-like cAMP-binding protein
MVENQLPPIFNKQLRYIFKDALAKSFVKKEYIYNQKEISNFIFYIEKGAVRIFDYLDGVKQTRFILYATDIFGMEGFFGQSTYELYAEPFTETVEVKVLTNKDLKNELLKDVEMCLEFIRYLELQRKFWFDRFVAKSCQQSEKMVIYYLEHLADRIGKKIGLEILIPIFPKHQDIAGILGVSRQTVSSTLHRLKEENKIYYDRKRLIIRNSEGKIF